MRKQVQQIIDILREVKRLYKAQDNTRSIDRLVNEAMHLVERRWGIESKGISDVVSRKYRPHIKNTADFKELVEDWLKNDSDALKSKILRRSNKEVDEQKLINDFFDQQCEVINTDNDLIRKLEEKQKTSYREGKRLLRLHLTTERNQKLVADAKKAWKRENKDDIRCSVCSFSFREMYGKIGDGYIEAHHKYPIHLLKTESSCGVDDLVPVCSNCHRMLHRKVITLTIEDLKNCLSR
jgi:predicted HNH restriction endonuclease